jgi:DNA transposition AAA+ family ATPase
MRNKIVAISNISRLSESANALMSRSLGMPGMGLVEGVTGYGKTTAITWLSIKLNGVHVRALSVTTPSSLLESICKELGIGRRATNVATVDDIVQKLAETGRPLFIDEADRLARKELLIETLRDIHDLSTVPVVLIGEGGFERKISHIPRLTGRISQWVRFEPATSEDAVLLARELAEVEVAADLVRELHKAANGSVRLIVVGLGQIEKFAKTRGLKKIGMADWPSASSFFLGIAPARRTPQLKVA